MFTIMWLLWLVLNISFNFLDLFRFSLCIDCILVGMKINFDLIWFERCETDTVIANAWSQRTCAVTAALLRANLVCDRLKQLLDDSSVSSRIGPRLWRLYFENAALLKCLHDARCCIKTVKKLANNKQKKTFNGTKNVLIALPFYDYTLLYINRVIMNQQITIVRESSASRRITIVKSGTGWYKNEFRQSDICRRQDKLLQ